MVWYLAGLLTAMAVAVIAPILVFIVPPPAKGSRKGDLNVTLDKPLSGLEEGQGIRFDAPKGSAFLMADGGGDNAPGDLAFSGYAVMVGGKVNVYAVNCSHLGCSVALNDNAHRFECPCHGSQFHLDGTVLHGPAAFPLSNLTWKQLGDKQLGIYGLTLGQGG